MRSARQQLKPIRDSGAHTVAFMGTTSIDDGGLKTKTSAEVDIKGSFIEVAKEIFVLADHSKLRNLIDEGTVFSTLDRRRMTIVTDRVVDMEPILQYVKSIR